MLRKMLLMFGLLALASFVSPPAHAQDESKVEVFGGYSFLRLNGINLNGWEASGQYKFTDWLGGVGDFAGQYRSGASNYTYLFGPQVSLPSSRISPFGHLLFGGAHFSALGAGTNSFALAVGGGVDAGLTDRISLRAVQLDYLLTQYGGGSQNNFRVSTGIVFRF